MRLSDGEKNRVVVTMAYALPGLRHGPASTSASGGDPRGGPCFRSGQMLA